MGMGSKELTLKDNLEFYGAGSKELTLKANLEFYGDLQEKS